MTLKAVYATQEDVPEALRDHYVEGADGDWHVQLDVDAGAELAKVKRQLADFRNRNRALLRRAADLAGVDKVSDDLGELAAKLDDLAGAEGRVQSATDQAIQGLQAEVAKLREERDAVAAEQRQTVFRDAVWQALEPLGARSDTREYLVGEAAKLFELAGGEVEPKDGVFSPSSPGEPLSVSEWAKGQASERSWAFAESRGADAGAALPAGVRPGRPTPLELGELSADVAAGKIRFGG